MPNENESYLNLFNDRSTHYHEFRPRYAQGFLNFLHTEGILTDKSVVADVGCGTGILSQQLIGNFDCTVVGVEPNEGMRNRTPSQLKGNSRFHLLDATAEDTKLPANTVDVVVSGQAFHWFDPAKFRAECQRILKGNTGWVCLAWNVKQPGPMEAARKEIVERYRAVLDTYACSWTEREQGIATFFGGEFKLLRYDNPIINTRDQFLKRTLSASHALAPADPRIAEYLQAWEDYFDRFQEGGVITIPNHTVAYCGRIEGASS